MEESIFIQNIVATGGKIYAVGGWVRDTLRGETPKDKDYVIAGLKEQAFCTLFPLAFKVGGTFPVYLLEIGGAKSEVAFARSERKTGMGYRGFAVEYNPNISIEEDLFRRDTTMNSMAIDLETAALVDPYGGQNDLKHGIIRATSVHFSEDPVRALRAARQAAEFRFEIAPETLEQMRLCAAELAKQPRERRMQELRRALCTPRPSIFFRCLAQADLLYLLFAPIARLIGKTQPLAYHPEGDAFEHTMLILDHIASQNARAEVRFAALLHDIGKGLTAEADLPHHYRHEITGLTALDELQNALGLPKSWQSCAAFVIREHMRAITMRKAGKITELLLKLEKHPLGFDGFNAVVRADHGILPDFLEAHALYCKAIHNVDCTALPKSLSGKQIGIWIRQRQVERCAALLKARGI